MVKKNQPDWQKGKLNGIGGKVETDETSLAAMVREWDEETIGRIPVLEHHWRHFLTERGRDWTCYFYTHDCSQLSVRPVPPGANDVGELLGWIPVERALEQRQFKVIGNLLWLLPMAMDERRPFGIVEVEL